jgi:hypothetical protein
MKPPATSGTTPTPLPIFISYSHIDAPHVHKLRRALAPLVREGLVKLWYDREIKPGEEYSSRIAAELGAAKIILLVVSPDFISSDYCYGIELAQALQKHKQGTAIVIPVVVRPTDWSHTPFSRLQALPDDANPVTKWRNRDSAYLNIAQGLRRLIQGPGHPRSPSPTTQSEQGHSLPASEPLRTQSLELVDERFDKKGRVRRRRILKIWSDLPPATRAMIVVGLIGAGATVTAPAVERLLVDIWPVIGHPTSTPSPTPTTTRTATPTLTPTSPTATPTPSQTSTPSPLTCEQLTISISEVMLVPIPPNGIADLDKYHEYVELFNYGDLPIDVRGFWIADRGGHPSRIVSWNDRFAGIPLGAASTTATIIQPGSFALILPPAYERGTDPYSRLIPAGVPILTLADTFYIGDGLVATEGFPLDVLILYRGLSNSIECRISTYGTPTTGSIPSQIADLEDDIPFAIPEEGGWGGFYRVYLSGIDSYSNWKRFTWDEKTPGVSNPTSQTESPN